MNNPILSRKEDVMFGSGAASFSCKGGITKGSE